MMLMLNVHPSRAADIIKPDQLRVSPAVPFTPLSRRLRQRLHPSGGAAQASWTFAPTPWSRIRDCPTWSSRTPASTKSPSCRDDALVFLLASRYCETDASCPTLAWSLFGDTPPGWARVQAICDFVHDRITLRLPARARRPRPPSTAHAERRGVCRDFAHLAVTLCRCMNIPARYCTGYLGDIGVPPVPAPMDFSAWFEVYLGGRWYTFDARHNVPRIGRILMARGRDAADVAISDDLRAELAAALRRAHGRGAGGRDGTGRAQGGVSRSAGGALLRVELGAGLQRLFLHQQRSR